MSGLKAGRRSLGAGLVALATSIAVLLLAPVTAVADDERDSRWREDLKVMADGVTRNAKPLLDDAAKKERFLDAAAELGRNVSRMTDEQIAVGMMRALAAVGDSHMYLNFAFYRLSVFPMSLYWFDEGIYVIGAAEGYEHLLGTRVLSVGDSPIGEVLERIRPLIAYDSEAGFKSNSMSVVTLGEILKGVGVTPDASQARFLFRRDDGRQIDAILKPVAVGTKSVSLTTTQLRYSQPDQNYWFKVLADSGSLYFQYLRCVEMKSYPFSAFAKELLNALDGGAVKRLIVDVRDNGGGNSAILDPLIDELARRSNTSRGVPIYVLIGRRTFSSAAQNALTLKEKAGAIFVGEPTGFKPNGYGEVLMLQLPNSRLRIQYSTKYWRLFPAYPDAPVAPTVLVSETWQDFAAGQDPALSAIPADMTQFERRN